MYECKLCISYLISYHKKKQQHQTKFSKMPLPDHLQINVANTKVDYRPVSIDITNTYLIKQY